MCVALRCGLPERAAMENFVERGRHGHTVTHTIVQVYRHICHHALACALPRRWRVDRVTNITPYLRMRAAVTAFTSQAFVTSAIGSVFSKLIARMTESPVGEASSR